MNLLVLRQKVDPCDTVMAFIRAVDAAVQEAKLHEECSFEEIVAESEAQRDISTSPLFQVGVVQ